MLHTNMEELAREPLDRSLDRLEAEIWRRIEQRLEERRRYRRALAAQTAILALGTLGSLAAGHQWAASHQSGPRADVFSPYTHLAAFTSLTGTLP